MKKKLKLKKIRTVVGLDFAMDGLYVDSERVRKPIIHVIIVKCLEKLAKEQRNFSRKKKGSARLEKQRIRSC